MSRTKVLHNVAMMVLAGAVLAGCPMHGGFKPESPDPKVWVDSDRFDFGHIPGTDTVSHIFSVKNVGGQPLNIARVQTSCGCTAAVLGNQFLKPGEQTQLKITFDPRGRHGQQARTIWIHSNDPKDPQKQLMISSDIAEGSFPQATAGTATVMTGSAPAPLTPAPAATGTVSSAATAPAAAAAPAPAATPAPTTAPAAAPAPKPAAKPASTAPATGAH